MEAVRIDLRLPQVTDELRSEYAKSVPYLTMRPQLPDVGAELEEFLSFKALNNLGLDPNNDQIPPGPPLINQCVMIDT